MGKPKEFRPHSEKTFVHDFKTWFKRFVDDKSIYIDKENESREIINKEIKHAIDFYIYCLTISKYLLPIPLLSEDKITGDTQLNAFLTVVIREFPHVTTLNYMKVLQDLEKTCKKNDKMKRFAINLLSAHGEKSYVDFTQDY